jgi:hypothetical protein
MKRLLLILTFTLSVGLIQAQNSLTDGGFEAGTPSTAWVETSTNFGTPLCDAACGTCGGPCAPATGTWYTWFGGFSGGQEIATATQTFNVATAGAAALEFNYNIAITNRSGNDTMLVILDGNVIMSKTDLDTAAAYYAAYDLLTFNLGTLSAGSHTLLLYANTSGTPGVTNFLIDDVSITVGGTSGFTNYDFENGIVVYTDNVNNELNLNFNFGNTYDLNVTLIDMMGKVVTTNNYSNVLNESFKVNTSDLKAGMYNVVIDKGSERITKKIIIE